MASTRSSALREIMKIEKEINDVIRSSRFRKMEENIAILKNQSGSSMIIIEPPENGGRSERIRKNSLKANEYLLEYVEMRNGYNKILTSLNNRRDKLRKELF
jgi:hypothetical protein